MINDPSFLSSRMHTRAELEASAHLMRQDLINMTWHSGTKSLHIGGSLSVVEILTVLYQEILRISPTNPQWEERDRIILSKGHCSAALYAAMAQRGFFPRERLFDSFNTVNGILEEHISMRTPGAEIPTGALGMGLSFGVGAGYAAKYLCDREGKPLFWVYVVLGDGELQEGQVWEAAMSASHFGLDNLIAIIDYNGLQVSGRISEVMNIEPLAKKWEAFGWSVQQVNGHDVDELYMALREAQEPSRNFNGPRLIIAKTIKGKGVSFMEDNYEWHAGHLTQQLYDVALEDLSR
jgi:transketolase